MLLNVFSACELLAEAAGCCSKIKSAEGFIEAKKYASLHSAARDFTFNASYDLRKEIKDVLRILNIVRLTNCSSADDLDLLAEDCEAVDHRLQLFLDVEVFEEEEELHFFLKVCMSERAMHTLTSNTHLNKQTTLYINHLK